LGKTHSSGNGLGNPSIADYVQRSKKMAIGIPKHDLELLNKKFMDKVRDPSLRVAVRGLVARQSKNGEESSFDTVTKAFLRCADDGKETTVV
jgi:hypothetical protein